MQNNWEKSLLKMSFRIYLIALGQRVVKEYSSWRDLLIGLSQEGAERTGGNNRETTSVDDNLSIPSLQPLSTKYEKGACQNLH